jgi:2-hydroxychromene-2-carboxylate isomerase
MSLKTWLTPHVMQFLLDPAREQKRRAATERKRQRSGEPHTVHYFHQTDDPYSQLLASVLPQLEARYKVRVVVHHVSPPADSAAPERAKLQAYSLRDAQLLAAHYGMDWQAATQAAAPPATDPNETRAQADALRTRWGHYLGATLYYGGEWYWGIDRLHHLESRLQSLGAAHPGVAGAMFPPGQDLTSPIQLENPPDIDFFFSLRSPYSAIVCERVFRLGKLTGAKVNLRFVLPMVMRGLPVPREKRLYIVRDTAREARLRGTAFGRMNDPVGRPTERGLSLMPLAIAQGKGEAFVASFMRGVWAEGLDAGADDALFFIAARAGLTRAECQKALQDSSWRTQAESNRAEMMDLGLWGVPSFRVGNTNVWGQDRLWAVQEAVLRGR